MDSRTFAAIRPEPISFHADERGALWKAFCAGDLGPGQAFGEVYLLFTRPGAVRGNHYHKKTTEWFLVCEGRMRCRIVHPEKGERREFLLDGAKPQVLKMPPGVAHALRAEGDRPALLAALADREYDAESPDRVPFEVDV